MKLLGIELRLAPQVAENSAAELWVTKDGRRMTVGEMTESHAKHALALIMRNVRAGRRLEVDVDGRISFRAPLVDADTLAAWEIEHAGGLRFDGASDWEREFWLELGPQP